jgi:hypothetical protein
MSKKPTNIITPDNVAGLIRRLVKFMGRFIENIFTQVIWIYNKTEELNTKLDNFVRTKFNKRIKWGWKVLVLVLILGPALIFGWEDIVYLYLFIAMIRAI